MLKTKIHCQFYTLISNSHLHLSQIEENNLGFPNNKKQIDRVITLQSLFEIDLNGNDYDKVIQRISNNYSLESVNLEFICVI